jgi:hemolysin III
LLLFGTSGVYHRGSPWGPRGEAILRRMDHANIYVFIAATYTPLALMMLTGTSRVLLLTVVWSAALLGLLFRLFWLSAPRWLYTALYLLMGWAAVGARQIKTMPAAAASGVIAACSQPRSRGLI